MPALQSTRQASQTPWFDSEPAAALRVLERQLLLPQLSVLPAQPWLWIAPSAAWLEDAQLGGRGLRLYRQGPGYGGDTRCGLPLPLLNSTHKCNAHPCMHFVRRLPAQALARA